MIDSEKMIGVIDLEETTTPVAEQAEQRATSEGHDEANSTNLHSTSFNIALLFKPTSGIKALQCTGVLVLAWESSTNVTC